MPARVSESFVLQTWPFREGDLIVSFLTRDLGKLRGVAKRARRPKSGFGSGLERLSHIKMSYFQRENRELVNLDSCEIVHSQFAVLSDFAAACALDFFAEVSEQMLPAAEPSEPQPATTPGFDSRGAARKRPEGAAAAPSAEKQPRRQTPIWTYVGVGFAFGLVLLGIYQLYGLLAH